MLNMGFLPILIVAYRVKHPRKESGTTNFSTLMENRYDCHAGPAGSVEFPHVQEPTPAPIRAMKNCFKDCGRHWMNPSAIGLFEQSTACVATAPVPYLFPAG
jgi:hypothetical protein